MFSKIGLLVMILSLSMPASGQTIGNYDLETIGQFSSGAWTGTAKAINGTFTSCTIESPKSADTASLKQLSFTENAEGRIYITFEGVPLPPAKCPDSGFMGSGLCLPSPAPSSDVFTPVEVDLEVDGLKDMKSYKGTKISSDTVSVKLPPEDDLIARMKAGRSINGIIPSMNTFFWADLGSSLIPFTNSAAYNAIVEMRKCVFLHARSR